ncbi:hypothetical protein SBOR_9993 [Sclerotinia borealis F-4128]|uniref:BTB domain-containing protein n=1 Tax=Sclerotinia borealis (strain F-4128) TaxID=1432307 RepID=W9C143_SCLBF|nr:hypothetical protein SBOR_9993 [Sclerotinia borealis F-4128]
MPFELSARREKPIETPVRYTLGIEIVSLIVGPNRTEVTVHKRLICDSCDYFRKALDGPFLEGVEGKIYFTDDSSDALYLLSEKWCFYDLGNVVIDVIIQFFWISDRTPSYVNHLLPEVVSHIWSHTEEHSPLRGLCIKRLAWIHHDDYRLNIIPGRERLRQLWIVCKDHSSFFGDTFAYYQNLTRENMPPNPGRIQESRYSCDSWIFDFCSYHRHNKGEECIKPMATEEMIQDDEPEYHDYFADMTVAESRE